MKDDLKGIEILVEVLCLGFYLGFYNLEFSKLNEWSYYDKCLFVLKVIVNNLNFKLGILE